MGTILTKKNILIGVTGSIAAFKAIEVVRILKDRGLNVKVVMTHSAKKFVSELTFETLSGNKVISSLWESSEEEGIDHIEIGDWADVYAIIPATADTIASLAHGRADNELLAAALVSRAPLLIAPAMNTNMLEHPATKENLTKLEARGAVIIPPGIGDLACGWNGAGRLADPFEISYRIFKASTKQDFKGKKVLVTAGPTREEIDPVRFISNGSSGKMGTAVAIEAYLRGAEVEIVHGPVNIKVPNEIKLTPVVSAKEMHEAVIEKVYADEVLVDVVVMTAAVADIKPKKYSSSKIKKSTKFDNIELARNADILKELGEKRTQPRLPYLVGFAVETGEEEELIESIKKKIADKKVDLIVGNLADEAFNKNTNHVFIIDSGGRSEEVQTTFKSRVARKIFDYIKKSL